MHRKLFSLIVVFLFLFTLPCQETKADDYTYMAVFSNVYATVQNSYVTEIDNWVLLQGALKELNRDFGKNQFSLEDNGARINIIFMSGDIITITRGEVANNAYVFLKTVSDIWNLLFQQDPSLRKNDISYATINGMIKTLDPYSSFKDPENYSKFEDLADGDFGGIGIELTIRDNKLIIVSPIMDTPAHRRGLKTNDIITAINRKSTASMSLEDASLKIRGRKGTTVALTIMPANSASPQDITLVREEIPLYTVKTKLLAPGYPYIRIMNFLSTTSTEVREALHDFQKKGEIKGLVLDLRNNPGGLLEEAVNVADIILDKGLIVSAKGRHRSQNLIFHANANFMSYYFPVIILVNGGSASGSEILAAALKFNNRAMLLGTQTFGKGSIQTVFPMRGGAALFLTTAYLFTPNAIKIHENGIAPDLMMDVAGEDDPEKSDENDPQRDCALTILKSLPSSQSHISSEIIARSRSMVR